ncbi:hypothetical protein F4861DRAFT_421891 [Xylaria intraflava]|nr:hypothetical protein F4861DRAFT_421891 [Xylaria intraflava]
MTAEVTSQKRRNLLITAPRTASSLLIRILNLDKQNVRPAHQGGYFFFPSVIGRVRLYGKPPKEWTPQEYANVNELERHCLKNLQNHVEASEAAGQRVYVKEHAGFLNSIYTDAEQMGGAPVEREPTYATQSKLNLTCLPDEYLKTWHPTFLIRHPAMLIPSLYRTAQTGIKTDGAGRPTTEPLEQEGTMTVVRTLYDFYVEYFGESSEWPLILDADDVITSPELMIKYAGLVGLDADKLQFTWERMSKEEEARLMRPDRVMLGTINSSTGLIKEKAAGNIDIDAEAVKWRAEFGDAGGKKIERWVRQMMPDYEYMRSRRLTL